MKKRIDKVYNLIPYKGTCDNPSDTWEHYVIDGLTHVYFDPHPKDLTYSMGGAVALLKHEKYPDYCQMFYVCRQDDKDGIDIRFSPCYTKDGDYVFIKYPHDCIFCMIRNGLTEKQLKIHEALDIHDDPNAILTFKTKEYGIDF